MTATNPNIREALDLGPANQLADLAREISMGEALSMLLAAMTPTEVGVVPVANVATLAAKPSVVYDVVVTAGGVTGRKKLLKGAYTASQVPSGYVGWAGGLELVFSAADGATAIDALYANGASPIEISLFSRNLGQRDVVE